MEPLEIGEYYRFSQGGSRYIMVIHGKTVLNGKYIIEQITDNIGQSVPHGYLSVWQNSTIATFKVEKIAPGTTSL